MLSKYSVPVFGKKQDDRFASYEDNEILPSLWITEEDPKQHLLGINILMSTSQDNFHPGILKELTEELSGPRILINKLWNIMEIPKDWMNTSIVPIFKKGNQNDPDNYRLLSLTSIARKTM